jgi:hypothetical protein
MVALISLMPTTNSQEFAGIKTYCLNSQELRFIKSAKNLGSVPLNGGTLLYRNIKTKVIFLLKNA